MISPKYHIFVCASSRISGVGLIQKFMQEIEDRDISADCLLRTQAVSASADKGPVAVVYPEGVWYGNLDEDAVEEICEKHLKGGIPVEEYKI